MRSRTLHQQPTARDPYTPPPCHPVCIIGGTGALGFGLALQARPGRRPDRDRLARRRTRAQESRTGLPSTSPTASFAGLHERGGRDQAEIVILSVPFRNQSETMTHLKPVLKPGQLLIDATVPLAAAVSGKATRTLGVWQGSAAQAAQEMAPEGVRVVAAFHTVSAALLRDLEHELDEDVLICGDKREDKAQGRRARRSDPRLASRRLRPARDGADRRAADAADHLDQRAQQGPGGHQDHRPVSGPVVVLAGGHRRGQARPRDARRRRPRRRWS